MDRTELRVTLPGAEGAADAWRAVAALQRLLVVLGQLEDVELRQDVGGGERSKWGFKELRLGSLMATVAPSQPRRGASLDTMSSALDRAVEGFAVAEERPGIPPGWNMIVAQTGAELARMFSAIESAGLRLELIRDGHTIRQVTVTRTAEQHLSAGLRVRHKSIGSVIGHLDSATLHGRREASLWLGRSKERVVVAFEARDVDAVRAAWGRRVEVVGVLERDPDGRLVKVRMRSLEILAGEVDSPPLPELIGLDPDMTDGLDAADYLREIRGSAQ